ncbi:MAG: chemotaxis protein CheC [Gemmatimonadaceae bacterium]
MIDLHTLSDVELDALREVASIGAGHAATALSEMTGSTIMISVPRIAIARTEDVPHQLAAAGGEVAIVHMQMLGDLTGRTFLILPCAVALRLAELMLRRTPGSSPAMGALESSAIKEAGNILCGAYMNALSDFLGVMLMPSPPTLALDGLESIVAQSSALREDRELVFAVETQFFLQDRAESLRGFFVLLPDAASLELILASLRVS